MDKKPYILIGVGHAGGQAIECLLQSGLGGFDAVFADTDGAEVGRSNAPQKVCLASASRRGLGAGGDPEQGRLAAEGDLETIRELVKGARLVCIFAGLGGGTGSGAAPVIARVAREGGALVLGLAAMPFQFEGRRRAEDAQTALNTFKKAADAVICVSNQRVMRMLDERTPLVELVAHANTHLVQAFRGLWQSLTQPGLIPVDFAHVEQLFRGRHAESCFATVEATGEHRVREIIDKIGQHPFLDQGAVLAQARTVLVSLAGGPDLTAPEVERLMDQLYRQCEAARVVTGAVVDEALKGLLRVTLIATWGGIAEDTEKAPTRTAEGAAPADKSTSEPAATADPGADNDRLPDESPLPDSVSETPTHIGAATRFVPAAPHLDAEQRRRVLGRRGRGLLGRKQPQQLLIDFDVVAKSRFQDTEAQRVKGQNLDIPTFIRRGIALN